MGSEIGVGLGAALQPQRCSWLRKPLPVCGRRRLQHSHVVFGRAACAWMDGGYGMDYSDNHY